MYPFETYEARDGDGNVTSSASVYRVTEDHNGEQVTTTGGVQQIHTGDVLVQAPNPNYVDVLSGDVFDGLGYASPQSTATPDPAPVADPAPEDAALTDSQDAGV